MTDIRKIRVPGLVGVDPSRQANMGLLERVASGINNLYSDPRRARGMTNMGMALMDAAGPQMPGQQISTGQMLARGLAGFQQGATAYDAEQMALSQQALQEAQMAQQLAAASGQGVSDRFDMETKLRDRFRADNRQLFQVTEAGQRVIDSATDPSAAGDLALIFNYMKMLDPGSTVREGEFANAQNASGVPGRIVSLYNNIIEGTRLNEQQRADFVGRAADLYKGTQSILSDRADRYRGLAQQYSLNPENVAFMDAPLDFSSVLSPPAPVDPVQPSQPAPADMRELDGVRYVKQGGQWFIEE